MNWLKYFTLNFFNKKNADESKKRSLWNGILSFLLAIVALYAVLCIMANVTFPINYNKSTQFKTFYHGLFTGDNAISIKIENGQADYVDDDVNLVINSFVSAADKEKYSANGYNVIVDLRDNSKLYNDCKITYVKDDITIEYDEYIELGDAKKEEYTIRKEYGNDAIEFSEETIASYVSFINEHGSDEDKQSLEALLTDGVVNVENYGAVYELYFESKYSVKATTMRDYYLSVYLSVDDDGATLFDNYVILLHDVALVAWHTDNGQVMSLSGYYTDINLEIGGDNYAQEADELAVAVFDANKTSLWVNYALYMGSAIFTIVFIWLLLPMFISIIGFISKYSSISNYGEMAKTLGGFWLGSAIPSLLFVVIASFFMSQTYVFYLSIGILIGVAILRTIIHFIPAINAERKEKRLARENPSNDENVSE